MSEYNILEEVREIANSYMRPDNVATGDWAVTTDETKSLLIRIEELMKPLEGAYWEAVRTRDWERALLTYQCLVGSPRLFSLNRTVWGEQKCRLMEYEFITNAREWLNDVRELRIA